MVTIQTGKKVTITVRKPEFVSGHWAEAGGEPITTLKWLSSKVFIMLKTKSMPDGAKISITLKEWSPTWFLKDEVVQEYPDIAEVHNNEAKVEIQLKDEWYKEEKDQQNELYFIAVANFNSRKIQKEFNADKAKETLKVVKSQVQSIAVVPMLEVISQEWENPEDNEDRITVAWNYKREYQIQTNPVNNYNAITNILIDGQEIIDNFDASSGRIWLEFTELSKDKNDLKKIEIKTDNGSRTFGAFVSLFKALWDYHPAPKNPCDVNEFPNQCAISMGVAIEKAGIDTSTYKELRCTEFSKYASHYEGPNKGQVKGHIRSADMLAQWIERQRNIFGSVKKRKRSQEQIAPEDYNGKTGIVYIMHGWEPLVSHIDVWDGKKSQDMKRGTARYLERGKEVWLWETE